MKNIGRTLLVLLITALTLTAQAKKVKETTLLYWNIQNGMWAEQGDNYNKFVDYVNSIQPDICVWAEAKTHYKTQSDESFKADDDLYLPKNWDKLAARYGHKYVYVGGERDFFPQVITSKYPIKNVKRLTQGEDGFLVAHGAGWATLKINGKVLNIVTMHTWPQRYDAKYRSTTPKEILDASIANSEGDKYRAKEVEYVCNQTIHSVPGAEKQNWIMLGDMNSISRVDNGYYKLEENSPKFLCQDYIMQHTPYIDICNKWFKGEYKYSHYNHQRIDYIYCTEEVYKTITDFEIVIDGYPANHKVENSKRGFCYPSDHFPILMKMK